MDNEIVCFDFRLIEGEDGTQIIDNSVKTPMDALTPERQIEYMEVDRQLAVISGIRAKERREEQRRRKLEKNPFWRFACFCGLI